MVSLTHLTYYSYLLEFLICSFDVQNGPIAAEFIKVCGSVIALTITPC